MEPIITDDLRARYAFIEALRRTEDMDFSKDEIKISHKKKIGDPIVCTVEAQKRNGDSRHATGQAYIYPDLIVVCIESVWKTLMDPTHPHHYEYLCF
ncbi:MAG: hypothetical protein ABFD82_06245 [Syntrophaceae bacterium]